MRHGNGLYARRCNPFSAIVDNHFSEKSSTCHISSVATGTYGLSTTSIGPHFSVTAIIFLC
jgi:hypothetical protein